MLSAPYHDCFPLVKGRVRIRLQLPSLQLAARLHSAISPASWRLSL